ncbi:MMPL family transporter [Nitrosospira sp. Is2]|uniref:MMPL family transporter n=1 Tax=Nitrosospira sp. Is2 TaxID=3080532 RepID=UPI002953CDFB|nr:MMPL family transporter [Nitrosospira sp. Is2]WON75044.1 MMPL family transporter [Nitrosospira sp. Is2]
MTTPTKASPSRTYEIFARWSTISYRHGAWVLLAALLVAVACGIYVSRNLGMNTDTTDMLSEHLPFRVNMKHYNETFPQDIDTMLLVVEAPTPEQARTTAQRLTERLKTDTTNFHDIYAPTAEDFFVRNGLLYESIPELAQITDRIAAAQPLIAHIARDPTLPAFADVLMRAVDEMNKGRSMELRPVMGGVSATLDARIEGSSRALSWQSLFNDEAQKNKYKQIIVVKPKLDFSQLLPAEQSTTALHAAARDVGITEGGPIRLHITGEAALAGEELKSSLSGMEIAGIITFVMVGMVLYFAMRTGGLIINVLVCLTMGLLLTAAFATAAVGHLNVISIAFAVLYIGLGADFAIHFLLRYREVLEGGPPPDEAIRVSGGDAGAALTACTITNAIGFYAFIPTDFSGVAELGIISGTGMIISLLVTLTIGPALLRCLPQPKFKESMPKSSVGKVLELSLKWHRVTYAATVAAALAALVILPQVRFDYNLLNMQDPTGDAVQAFRELIAEAEDSPWHSIALVKERKEAEDLAPRLAKLPEVSKVITIQDFVPPEQEEKLLLIEEMALTMGPIAISPRPEPPPGDIAARQRHALNALAAALNRFIKAHPDHSATETARKLKSSLASLFTRLDIASKDEQGKLLNSVEDDLLVTLPTALQSLRLATEAAPFGEDDLPVELINRWHSPTTGEYRVAIYPAEDLNDNDALRRFVRSVQQVAPNATGAPMVSLEAGEAVVKAFVQAFLLALVGIIIILLILLRSLKYTILVLLPLLLSSIFTASFTVLLGVPFNFANIIALPLLLGLGIDSSLHMVHRSLNNEMVSEVLIHTSTARAIFYSALTALVDFASLMFSSHQGTASMGIMLTVGLTFTLVCTLAILPVLLRTPAQGVRA